jgi:hypothetical protein
MVAIQEPAQGPADEIRKGEVCGFQPWTGGARDWNQVPLIAMALAGAVNAGVEVAVRAAFQ